MKIWNKILVAGFLLIAMTATCHSAETQVTESKEIQQTVERFWSLSSTHSKPGESNIKSFKSLLFFPVTFVGVTVKGVEQHFLLTEEEFDKASKAAPEPDHVPLNESLTDFKAVMLNPQLATVTYQMHIPKRRVYAHDYGAQTLNMQTTLIMMDKNWKVVFTTTPFNV